MACCVIAAYLINKIIKACELLDVSIVKIQYNDSADFPSAQCETATGPETRHYQVIRFSIEGMTCAACTSDIETAVSSLPGVERLTVSLPLCRATVVFDRHLTCPADIVRVIQGAGYDSQTGDRTAEQNLELLQHTEELMRLRGAFGYATVMSSIAAAFERALAWKILPSRGQLFFHGVLMLLGIWVQVFCASWIHRNAWRRRGKFELVMTMDTLISLSLLLGLSLSLFNIILHGLFAAQTYFASGSFLATIIIGGRYLDLLLKRKSLSTFSAFYRLQSEMTNAKIRKGDTYLPAVLLRPQDEIIIEPGSIIPCDGYVIGGTSLVDLSTMTGESMPAVKKPGDLLMSGTRNLTSLLTAIVSVEQSESSLERLIESISSATEEKIAGNGAIDTLTANFVKSILVITSLAFGWTYAKPNRSLSSFEHINIACERAMAILAAACPCALGLATPSAIMAGLDAGWSRGVILTGGSKTMDSLEKVSHVVLDKTGTLTEGRLSVCKFDFLNSHRIPTSELCMYLCAAERHDAQRHPIARVVFQWALLQLDDGQKGLQNQAEVRNFSRQLGKGVSCELRLPNDTKWHGVHLGNEALLQDHAINVTSPLCYLERSTTVVYIAVDGQYTGFLALQDTIRLEAPAVIQHLKAKGMAITMLTGDVEKEARRVSKTLGINVISSQQLPHQKKAIVQSLQAQGHTIAMLGDGLNDLPAQAVADIGIQFLPSGACIGDVAGMIITSPNLARLPEMLEIARQTMRQGRWNIKWAVLYNVCTVSLAMGVGEPWGIKVDASVAATLMAFSSATVLGLSLLLCRDLRKVDFSFTGEQQDELRTVKA